MNPSQHTPSASAPVQPAFPPVVDTHAHVFTTDMPLAATAWHKPAADADTGQFMDLLDTHGITFGILAAASISGTNNDHPLEACRQERRLRTTVIVEPECPLSDLRAMAARGAVGIRFQLRNVAEVPDLASARYRPLLRAVADLGWHVQLHDDARRLPLYLPALEAAGVKVVVDHFGRPDNITGIAGDGFRRLLRSVERGRTWVKLSAPYRLESDSLVQAAAQQLLRHAGPERLMWGSDWPFAAFESRFSYAQALQSLDQLVPDVQARRRITCETPLQFYLA